MIRFYCILHFLGINFCIIFCIPNTFTNEPPFENPSKVPFVLPSYLPEKKNLTFDICFSTTLEWVLSNPESHLFWKIENGYSTIATSYHTNHLLKNHEK